MMYLDETGKKRFRENVPELLSAQKNDEILAMLENADLSDLVDCDGTTLLHLSVKLNNKFFIRYLIKKNVDINSVDCEGNTPFMLLVWRYTRVPVDLDIWKLFIDTGADLCKIKNNRGKDALSLAHSYYRESEEASDMMEYAMKTRFGSSEAMADALIKAHYRIYDLYVFPNLEVKRQMLVRGCDVNLQDSMYNYNTALHIAAIKNDLDDIKLLLEFGADKNSKNLKKLFPIDEILRNNHDPNREAVELLMPDSNQWVDRRCGYAHFEICSVEWLKNFLKSFVTTKYRIGLSALRALMMNENQEVWNVLKDADADLSTHRAPIVQNSFRRSLPYSTILHTAMLHNRPEAVQFLLNKGAHVDVLDSEGRSPLFYNATCNLDRVKSIQCVKILLRNGANVQLRPKNGDTIVSHLIKHQHNDALDLILCQLAMLDTRGSTLDLQILSHISSSNTAKDSFAKFKQELGEIMKKGVVYVKLLTCKDSEIWRFVKNDNVVQELYNNKCEGTTYLYQLLIERFERGLELDQMRKKARQLIIECIELFKGHELIIEIILDFFDVEDLKLIAT